MNNNQHSLLLEEKGNRIAVDEAENRGIRLSPDAEYILNLLSQNGFTAYIVGGCVRDYILGNTGGDIDITTSALPAQIKSVMLQNDIKVVETGLKHGTVTAVLNHIPYEITTFRTDGDYLDNRHPENVRFVTDVKEDLARRDFTMNAIAYNQTDGFVDAFGGVTDIENKIIRAVGDPDKRFKEDALRIMRAVRFASVLGFEFEEKTKQAIIRNKELLKNVSAERVFTELSKLLLGDNVLNVLDEYKEVIAVIIPELEPTFNCVQNNPWHIYNVYQHIIHAVAFAPKDVDIRLTMLLHDIGKPSVKTTDSRGIDHFKTHASASADIAEKVLKRLKVSNAILDKVVTLVRNHQGVENVEDIRVKRWLSKIGEDYTRALFKTRIADLLAHNPEKIGHEVEMIKSLDKEIDKIIESEEAFKISDLDISGNDLIDLGYKGKKIGDKLNEILSLVVDDKLSNEKEAIIEYINTRRVH